MLPCVFRTLATSSSSTSTALLIRMAMQRQSVAAYSQAFDPLEAKMAQKKRERLAEANAVDEHKTQYATKGKFDENKQDIRQQGAGAENGQAPTKWQKRFLVLTRLYASQKEIPTYVHNGTMNRMHDRMRAVFIVVGCFTVFTVFYIAEIVTHLRINRDKRAGVVVTEM